MLILNKGFKVLVKGCIHAIYIMSLVILAFISSAPVCLLELVVSELIDFTIPCKIVTLWIFNTMPFALGYFIHAYIKYKELTRSVK